MSDQEAAVILIEVERTRKQPKETISKQLDPEWRDGLTLAEQAGEKGTDQWMQWMETRCPKRVESMRRAIREVRENPATIPFPNEAAGDAAIPAFIRSTVSARVLAQTEYRTEWLATGILVADQPCVVGAPKKGMKTSTMIDLAVSLASGTAFLGEFGVPRPTKTWMLSGESGGFATKDTAARVCAAKGFRVEDLDENLLIGFDLPRLNHVEEVAAMADYIRENAIKVVIIDPLYLCLISASVGGRPIDAKNLFDVGPLLLEVSRTCLQAGATPILVHHNRMTSESFELPELSNLAFAGIQEFARQWILLGRRERYEPEFGIHKLWLTVGGSAGHSGEWALDIDVGVMDAKFAGRKWEVQVRKASEEFAEKRDDKDTAKNNRDTAKEAAEQERFRRDEEKIIEALRTLGGKSSKSLVTAGAKLNSSRGNSAINRLKFKKLVADVQVGVGKGAGSTPIMGIGLTELGHTPTNPDEPGQQDVSEYGANPDNSDTGDPPYKGGPGSVVGVRDSVANLFRGTAS